MAELNTTTPLIKLNDGTTMPMLGFGVGTAMSIADSSSKPDRGVVEAVKRALKLGYNHLDAAENYNTERETGIAIKESKVPREKLFVTTKVSISFDDIPKAIDRSLKDLQLDYVDLYLIHEPWFSKSDADLQKAWTAMETVKAAGKAKSIGVSNYLIPHLEATLKTASTPPSVNQVEYNPYLPRAELVAFHKKNNIVTSAYGPLQPITKTNGPLDDFLAALGKKYYVNPSEILLRWAIDQGVVPITTSNKEQRLSDYLRVLAFSLTPREVEEIASLGAQKHFRGFWRKKFDENDRS